MKYLIAIPAFNESKVIAKVITEVRRAQPKAEIVVIDDGSTDATSTVAESQGVIVIRHRMNRGLGGAIGTALEWAKRQQADLLITMDADGQHDPHDLAIMMEPIYRGKADIVIGSRLQSLAGTMPIDRKVLNGVANAVTWLFFGVMTTDSQSGFRAFSKKAIQSIHLRTERMEVSSEIFAEISRLKLKYTEVPIKVIYTDYSLTKGQRNSNGLAILFRLMLRLFR